jgi:hypothetical protein
LDLPNIAQRIMKFSSITWTYCLTLTVFIICTMNSENLTRLSCEFSTGVNNEANILVIEKQKRLVYNRSELFALRDHVYHRHTLNKLSNETQTIMNNLKIKKARKRGSRGGLKHQILICRKANLNNDISIITDSSDNVKSKILHMCLLNPWSVCVIKLKRSIIL